MHHGSKHPELGAGLLATIRLPVFGSRETAIETCARLNHLAPIDWSDVPVLGSWHSREARRNEFAPSYGVFIPNILYADRLATNMAIWSINVARWARQTLWPDLEDLTMMKILSGRFDLKQ